MKSKKKVKIEGIDNKRMVIEKIPSDFFIMFIITVEEKKDLDSYFWNEKFKDFYILLPEKQLENSKKLHLLLPIKSIPETNLYYITEEEYNIGEMLKDVWDRYERVEDAKTILGQFKDKMTELNNKINEEFQGFDVIEF